MLGQDYGMGEAVKGPPFEGGVETGCYEAATTFNVSSYAECPQLDTSHYLTAAKTREKLPRWVDSVNSADTLSSSSALCTAK